MGAGDEAPCPGSDPPVGKTGADPGRGEIRDGAAAKEAEMAKWAQAMKPHVREVILR